jgi:8-oxo-dGTP pyrophosphatase MutT (NUDIX family)
VSELRDVPEQWPVRDTSSVWDGGAPFAVRLDRLTMPDGGGQSFGRLVLEHPGAVVILAVDEDERALVLRQYRHPVGRRLVELPAGLLDQAGEDPELAARRELQEEGLLLADEWRLLLSTYPSPGLSSERIDIYLATGLHPAPDRGGFEPEHEEAEMTTAWVPVGDLVEAFLDGAITDGPLGHAVLAYERRHRG